MVLGVPWAKVSRDYRRTSIRILKKSIEWLTNLAKLMFSGARGVGGIGPCRIEQAFLERFVISLEMHVFNSMLLALLRLPI